MKFRFLLLSAAVALAASACSSDQPAGAVNDGGGVNDASPANDAGAPATTGDAAVPDGSTGGDGGDLPSNGDVCDNTIGFHCMLPFPSNHWVKADATTKTGVRVDIPREAVPRNGEKKPALPPDLASLDGFAPSMPLLAHFGDVDMGPIAGIDSIPKSLEADHPVVLIEAETGKRVPFFAELDALTNKDNERLFIIRPAARLMESTRYIAAVRNLKLKDGKAVEASPVFRIYRDQEKAGFQEVEKHRARFEDIFSKLDKAGVKRGELIAAWDLTTMSTENTTGRLIHMRDDALKRVGPNGPEFEIVSVTEDHSKFIGRVIKGRLTVPLYVSSPKAGASFKGMLDDKGMPQAKDTAKYEFIVMIPRSLMNGGAGGVMHYGHGLLGSAVNEMEDKGDGNYLQDMANRGKFALIGVDWIGMCYEDQAAVAGAVFDLSNFAIIPDRLQQGVLNALLLMTAMKGALGKDPKVSLDGKLTFDPNRLYYYGNSQGGIMGAVYMAASKDIKRGGLGVGGSGYSFMLTRSVDFTPFFGIMKSQYPTITEQLLLISMIQMLWQRAESAGYDRSIAANPLTPDTPVKQVLVHMGVDDSEVTNLSTYQFCRAAGCVHMQPANFEIFGLEKKAAPFEAPAALVEYRFPDAEPAPKNNTAPAKNNGAHGRTRTREASKKQLVEFLETGRVTNHCDGACDPE
ncbi:MAG: hypothetical protein GMKNLPBB_02078 [Myxococcota bacterium]|nr:hypothetical protein [Myxococcota bacterium]